MNPADRAAPWIEAAWPVPGVRGFSTVRAGAGVSQPPFDRFNLGTLHGGERDDPLAVRRNRALLGELARLPSPPRWLRQVHGTGVLRFEAPAQGAEAPGSGPAGSGPAGADPAGSSRAGVDPAGLDQTNPDPASPASDEPEADASVTSARGCVLAILTADCLPVLFAAADGSEVGAAHAGWRGLADGVLEATVAAMRGDPGRVHAWLGPAAGPRHYEIGAEVREAFLDRDAGAAQAFVATRPGHWRVDLYALARRRLAGAGVTAERVHGGGLCTIDEPERFFSHRRDRRTGRMATLIWMT